jgi:signal transduction histidine kinase/ActR/RegA family two-component response regulator
VSSSDRNTKAQTPHRTGSQWSLRMVVIVPFACLVATVVAVVTFTSHKSAENAVQTLIHRLLDEVSQKVHTELNREMAPPLMAVEANYAAIKAGMLTWSDPQKLATLFYDQIKAYDLSYLLFGLKDATHTATGHHYADDTITFDFANFAEFGDHELRVFEANNDGSRGRFEVTHGSVLVDGKAILQEEGWYKSAISRDRIGWSDVYNWEVKPYILSIAASRAIYNQDKQLVGVLGAEQSLTKLSEYLQSLDISAHGRAFIIERSGNLIAISSKEQPFAIVGGKPRRIPAVSSKDSIIIGAARAIDSAQIPLKSITTPRQISFSSATGTVLLRLTPWRDDHGLDWIVAVAVPESDFSAPIKKVFRDNLFFSLFALTLTLSLGWLLTQRLSKSIRIIQDASSHIAAGALATTVKEQSRIKEFSALAKAFNSMAGRINDSVAMLTRAKDELEERVHARTAELKIAKDNADAASRAKSDFLATMSHELRTPLNGILGYAQILKQSKTLSDVERRGINTIEQCSTHLHSLINDILDLSKIEARKIDVSISDFHLARMIEGVVELCRIKAEQKNIYFDYRHGNTVPTAIRSDEKLLRQVLINLIGNAIKFTDMGGVTLLITNERSDPKANSYCLRFEITDTGEGISSDDLARIFLPFEQGRESEKHAQGTGLGLPISKQIVGLLGGDLQVDSDIGTGSSFWFELQVEGSSKSWDNLPQTVEKRITGIDGPRRSILIVDDSKENRMVLHTILQPLGFTLLEAEHGKQALDVCSASLPDLIITDLMMPEMDGHEFIRTLRAGSEAEKNVRIISSSANVYAEAREQSLSDGANAFISKPIVIPELLALIAEQLSITWLYEH